MSIDLMDCDPVQCFTLKLAAPETTTIMLLQTDADPRPDRYLSKCGRVNVVK